jgi:hypothetical protein
MTDAQTSQAAYLQGEQSLEDGVRAHTEQQRMMEEEVGSREQRKFLSFLGLCGIWRQSSSPPRPHITYNEAHSKHRAST